MTHAGSFATARRGGLSMSDIESARKAIGPRATPSMIARYLGRCEVDVRGILFPPPAERQVEAPVRGSVMAPETPRPWTEEDIHRLKILYCDAGLPADACARALNRSDAATKVQIRKRGLTRVPRAMAS